MKLMLLVAVFALYCVCAAAPPRPVVSLPSPNLSQPPIGWCCFFPATDVGMPQLPDSGASILSVCAGGWGMAPTEGNFDFSAFDRQLAYARQHGLKLALINEINPFYAPAWLREKVRAAGQSVRGPNGTVGEIPSLSSAIFREAQEELVRRFVAHVRETDRTGTVAFYHPGAEWWFPMNERYHPADIARFQDWLRSRYRTIERLNTRWGARFADFRQVPAPALEMSVGMRNRTGMGPIMSLDSGAQHCSWSTPAAIDPQVKPGPDTCAAVEPGRVYTASANVKLENIQGYGVYMEIAWVRDSGGVPIAIDTGPPARGTRGWTHVSARFRAPKEARRAWILLKLQGTGTAVWDEVDFREDDSAINLAPNPDIEQGGAEPVAWRFQNWSGGRLVEARWRRDNGRNGSAGLQVTIPVADSRTRGYRRLDAAVYDWSLFWYETAADYINRMAALVRRHDPTRPTVTYLTFSFAYPAEWDYVQMYAIAPDEVARRGKDIDAFGMQVCSADGDPLRVTACLDLVRKYGKPMWTVDLVDFTSGVHIGFSTMNQVTHSAIQHGAEGIIYCAWHIPTVLDYSFHPYMAPADIRRMLTEAGRAAQQMEGMKIEARAAIVQPILPASPDDPAGFKNDYRSFMGWYRLLEHLHQTFDVVTLREIETGSADLRRYRWLLVPDCAYLSETARTRLHDFARRGGTLITGGRFALYDEIGRPLKPLRLSRTALLDFGRVYAGDPVRDTHAGNTPPLLLWRKETDATRRARREGERALKSLLAKKRLISPFRLEGEVSSLTCVEYTGTKTRAVYLVNRGKKPIAADRVRLIYRGRARSAEIYADTHRIAERRDRRGALRMPAFQTACIVKFRE